MKISTVMLVAAGIILLLVIIAGAASNSPSLNKSTVRLDQIQTDRADQYSFIRPSGIHVVMKTWGVGEADAMEQIAADFN